MRLISYLRSRRVEKDSEDAPQTFQACVGLPSVCWEHYPPGTLVQLTALDGPWRYAARPGMVGTVSKLIQGPNKSPEDDLYEVSLSHPLVSGKEVAYFMYHELSLAQEES